ncbi:hypothetical protein F2Q69_00047985 [Brassica cretica]|uniref:Arabidopsis retrotransposon Orf1 C-terminal domain-containing protein n=1 Tax=Brassica cretica TaxID=69181 RepID=A0A8S9PJ06_BRACR|nr:hypothetical protein F2Q69_00047985 [Brassica cretica]
MVGLFVERLMYYKDWVLTTTDSSPQLGIGGLITPLLIANGVNLGNDPKGPSVIDAPYLRIATYIGGRYHEKVVYTYYHKGRMVELLLPNRELTNIENPGIIHFNIAESEFFGPHGPIDPVTAPRRRRGGVRGGVRAGTSAATQEESATPIYGPPRYHFTQRSTALPHGPLREAHEHISNLKRWNKAQDRTIFKLKTKYKELKKTVKRQAEASPQFMKKVANLLDRGGVGGCSSKDFVTRDISVPQPQPFNPVTNPSLALGPPLTARQLLCLARNPEAPESNSGNKSPSLPQPMTKPTMRRSLCVSIARASLERAKCCERGLDVAPRFEYSDDGSARGVAAGFETRASKIQNMNDVGAGYGREVLEYPLEFLEILVSIWDQKESGKMLFERTEHRSGLRERPTTPAPDETKTVRPLAQG